VTDIDNVPDWARPAHEAPPDAPDWAKPAYSDERAPASRDPASAAVPDWAKPATVRAPAPAPSAMPDVPDWAHAAPPAADNAPGLGELAKRGFVQGGAALMRTVQNVGDALSGQGLSKQIAESQMSPEVRAAFHEQAYPLDTLAKRADEYAAPAPGETAPGLAGRVVQGASKLIPEVAGVIGTGGESAVPEAFTAAARAVPYLGRVLGGIAEGLPTAAKFTAEQASNLPDTMTPGEKLKQTAKDFGVNAAMAGLPAALGASPLVRVPTGAAIGAGQAAALSALDGQPQDAAQNIIGALQGGAFGLVPHAPQGAAPEARADSKVNVSGFESNPPTGNVFDQFNESEGLVNPFESNAVPDWAQPPQAPRFPDAEPGSLAHAANAIAEPGPAPNLVADADGMLRAAPKAPEQPTTTLPETAAIQNQPLDVRQPGTAISPETVPDARGGGAFDQLHDQPQDAAQPAPISDHELPEWVRTDPRTNPEFFNIPRPQYGNLLDSIARGGGLNLESFKSQYGVDPATMRDRALNQKIVGKPLFRRNGGMTPDELREALEQDGWLGPSDPNAPPQYAAHDAFDLVDRAMRGDTVLHPYEPNDFEANVRHIEDAQRQHYEDEQTARAKGHPNAEAMYRAEIPDYGTEPMYARTPSSTDDLFGGATARDRVDAAVRAKMDELRGGGRAIPMRQGDGELFAGPRPEQTRFDQSDRSAEMAGLQGQEQRDKTYVAAARQAWREQGTESPFFQHWFSGSKVTDAEGKPRMVFHGTSEDFNVFRDDRLGGNTGHMTAPLGHFLTESRAEARRYAEKAANGVPADERVIKSYLSIKNPAVMTKDQFLAVDSQDAARSLRQWLEQHGHDGIRLDLGNGKTQWIAFDSGQIKDVNNRGTFDRNNPDIRYARRGASESGTPLTKEEVSAHASRIVGTLAGEHVNADQRVPIRVVDSFEKLPDAPRKMAEAEGVRNGDIKALHVGGRSYLLADQMRTPADVQEAIFHEHYTHGGLRAKYGAELGPKLDELLHGVGGVDGVRRLAERQGVDLSGYEKALAENPKLTEQNRQRVLMEELLAHMSRLTGTLKRTAQEWVGAVRDWLRRNGFAELAKYGETDLAHVLRHARQAANEKAGTAGPSRPLFQRTPGANEPAGIPEKESLATRSTQPAAGSEKSVSHGPTLDELHEAHSIAKRGAFAKMFQLANDGGRTVVSYKGNEVARIDGPVNRKSLTAAVADKINARGPEPELSRKNAQKPAASDSSGNSEKGSALPPRGPGESQGAYVRRVSAEHADDLRAATALKGQQKTIGRHAIREMLGKRSRAMDIADAAFGEYRKLFDKTDPAKNLEHIDEWETGKRVTDPDMRAFLAQMKAGFNERVQRLRELDPRALQHLITHYMPHVYKDPAKAAALLRANVDAQAARHSIAGGKEFLEPRSWPTLKAAMRSGLEPITTNPVDWIMLRYASMDKLIGSLELRKELDAHGWLSKVKNDEEPPPGYKRVADPAFNGYGLPEPIARDITNYLDPGFSKYAAWRTLRGMQNFMVAADLGFSGFHATFTSTDNVIMHTDVALRRAAIGDSRGAAATLVKALTSVITSPFEGHKLNQQWRGIREADANTAAILDALERGGARWKMSTTEYQNAIPKLARMFRQMQGAGIGAHVKGKTPAQIAVGAIRVPLTALQAAAETGSYLIHHVLVPNQKMAARVLLYKYELDKRAQELGRNRGDYAGIVNAMNPDVVRQLAAQVNDVVDFRLGQMAYDNRFWPRVVQDVAQASVMAPGWQYGAIQTIGGAAKAVKDLASPSKLVAPLDRAGKITDAHMGRVGSNLSYFLTLALTLGGGMAALQYLLTGQGPAQIKDLFFPKTGRKNDDDSDERLQLPNYWVDHYKLSTEPAQTAENKIHPLWKMLWEVGHNKDYFGTRIRDPEAPALEQAQEVGKYLVSKFVPITFANMQKGQQRHETPAQQVGHFFGVNTAPARVARSDFQNFVAQGGTRGWGNYTKTPEEAQLRQQVHAASAAIRRSEEPDFGSLAPADQLKARKDAKLPVPAMLFKSLSDVDKLRAYDLATPDERERYGLHGVISRMHIERSAPFKRLSPTEQEKVRQRLQSIRGGEQ